MLHMLYKTKAIVIALQILLCLNEVKSQNHSTELSQEYSRYSVLDVLQNYYLYWEFTDTHITFELHVKTLGWVGLGISSNGGMIGADIQVGWVRNGIASITDRHGAKSNSFPPLDSEQNVELLASAECGGWTMIKYRRQLAACEANDDLPITTDTLRVIYAYGQSDPTGNDISMSDYHGTTRGVRSLLLLVGPKNAALRPPFKTEKSFTFLKENFKIPVQSTHYTCTMFKVPDLSAKVHLIKVEPIIQAGHELIVHHIALYQCLGDDAAFEAILGTTAHCYSPSIPDDFNNCRAVIHGWSIGGTTFSYPSHVGLPLGEADSPRYILMETHYDNPSLRQNMFDNSGLRLTYTSQLRQYDAGFMETGHLVSSYALLVPPNANNYLTYGECSSECLGLGMSLHNITKINVFGSILHAHLLAKALELKHIRNGRELKPIVKDRTYDFNYQEARINPEETVVQLGDELQAVCRYKSSGVRKNFTFGGFGTKKEMCTVYIFYYPKIPLTFCESSPDLTSIFHYFGISSVENVGGEHNNLNDFVIASPRNLDNKRLGDYLNSLNFTEKKGKNMSETFRFLLRNQHCANGQKQHPVSYQFLPSDITEPYKVDVATCTTPTTGFPTTVKVDTNCFTKQYLFKAASDYPIIISIVLFTSALFTSVSFFIFILR